jgi:ABC-type lipoprotein release transport system permease subunit
MRQRYKNIFISLVLSLLVFLLSSLFFVSNSLQYELSKTLQALPDIIVQKQVGGRHYDIAASVADSVLEVPGVSSAQPRVWGYYRFKNANAIFTLVGVDIFEEHYKKTLRQITDSFEFDAQKPSMVVGKGVAKKLRENYYKEYFNFFSPKGEVLQVFIAGEFTSDTALESNDMIVMSKELLRHVFGMNESDATDIAVYVANPLEVATIAAKIELLYPDCLVKTKEDIDASYQNLFDFQGGVFLVIFLVSLFTFFVIIYDKTSGVSSEEKREIGILKALGWRVDDILQAKLYEATLVSLFSYIVGVLSALVYVYIFQAPVLRDIFSMSSSLGIDFTLPFLIDFGALALVFFLTIPIYSAAILFPSWRVATLDVDEVMR